MRLLKERKERANKRNQKAVTRKQARRLDRRVLGCRLRQIIHHSHNPSSVGGKGGTICTYPRPHLLASVVERAAISFSVDKKKKTLCLSCRCPSFTQSYFLYTLLLFSFRISFVRGTSSSGTLLAGLRFLFKYILVCVRMPADVLACLRGTPLFCFLSVFLPMRDAGGFLCVPSSIAISSRYTCRASRASRAPCNGITVAYVEEERELSR